MMCTLEWQTPYWETGVLSSRGQLVIALRDRIVLHRSYLRIQSEEVVEWGLRTGPLVDCRKSGRWMQFPVAPEACCKNSHTST